MTKRTAKLVSAIAASFIAGAPFTTSSHSASAECLAGPKDQTPQGSHWHYHIDHATGRHCWYLGEEREKLSQASSANAQPAKSTPQKSESVLPRTVADARAELPAADNTGRSNQGPNVNSPTITPRDEKALIAEAQSSVVSSRWPDQSLADASVKSSPGKIGTGAAAGTPTNSTPNSTSKVQLASIQSVEQLAMADMPSQSQSDQTRGYSLQILLSAMAGALALAGIVTSLFMRFGNSGTNARRNDRDWSERQTGFARSPYPARDRASEFFAQISRRHEM